MLMAAAAAAVHMDSTRSSSAGSIISQPPWHPAVQVPVATLPNHHQAAAVYYDDPDLTAPSRSVSPPLPPPPRNHHQRLRPAAARRPSSTGRRRPRPSRKVPTTYITADPASFRRMVHQVTGADDLPPPPPPLAPTTLCRPAPSRAATAFALPTLDTSALLLGIRTTGPAAAAAAASEVDLGAVGGVGVGLGGPCGYGGGDCGGAGGFPTLESWDALDLVSHPWT